MEGKYFNFTINPERDKCMNHISGQNLGFSIWTQLVDWFCHLSTGTGNLLMLLSKKVRGQDLSGHFIVKHFKFHKISVL